MRDWLTIVSESSIVAIDMIAVLAIAYGTVEVVIRTVHAQVTSASNQRKREIWLGYARWLLAGLTFQLAADIIETSISTSWEAIGRLGAIAAIRTFLEFFLGRDAAELRLRQHETDRAPRVERP
jgi:uncharacterized membrane protein